ncbi:MAG: type II secretion system protein [Candidatus Saccharibacteria bacterium]|nr:MAG: type II secretion system protein [Candidatus Saccharibacteria bacterium]
MKSRGRTKGFTIVELLIVIVVIAILAAITIVAYNGIQGRARDSQRVQDMNTIIKALEVYKTLNGTYPAPVSTTGAAGWEVSTTGSAATNFLSALTGTSGVSKVPVDPTNTGVVGDLAPARNKENYEYFYYRYTAGDNGCNAARGDYYVVGVARMNGVASGSNSPQSPGFSCTGRDWSYEGAWVTGGYTK